MTCIVGLETEDSVIIGADSAAVGGLDIISSKLEKVFRRGDFLIGYTTSFRMGQLLQYKLDVEPQKVKQTDLEYLSTTFIDAVRKCLKDGGYAEVKNEKEDGGTFLIGYNKKLYVVYDDFQVNQPRNKTWAVGCGHAYALGSIFSNKYLSPKGRIKEALSAAEKFSAGVQGPFIIKEMK